MTLFQKGLHPITPAGGTADRCAKYKKTPLRDRAKVS